MNKKKNPSMVEVMKECEKRFGHLTEKDMKKCDKCGKKFIHDIDPFTNKKSKYLWKYNCKCFKSELHFSSG